MISLFGSVRRPLATAGPVVAGLARRLHVCVVGAGPAGIYTVDELIKQQESRKSVDHGSCSTNGPSDNQSSEELTVDVLERLPTPYGLLRYGVAPDHPEVKNTANLFESILRNNKVRYFGNVNVGTDILVPELLDMYDAVVMCTGAYDDKCLSIPGEGKLSQVHSAREFVQWYNSYPLLESGTAKQFEEAIQSTSRVVIVGQGNVALDCARVLARRPEELAETDISSAAIKALESSTVREIVVLGRRGPIHAAFTIKEFRELTKLKNVNVVLENAQFDTWDEATVEAVRKDRPTSRRMDLLKSLPELSPSSSPSDPQALETRRIVVRFFSAPKEFKLDDQGRVKSIVVELSKADGSKVVGTGVTEEIPCEFVLRSIGYRAFPYPAENCIPFDTKKGIVPNQGGAVVNEIGNPVNGLFVCGWLKRGASGVIPTNKTDAQSTVQNLLDRVQSGSKKSRPKILDTLLQRGVHILDFDAFKRLEAHELDQGIQEGKSAARVAGLEEMKRLSL